MNAEILAAYGNEVRNCERIRVSRAWNRIVLEGQFTTRDNREVWLTVIPL